VQLRILYMYNYYVWDWDSNVYAHTAHFFHTSQLSVTFMNLFVHLT